MGDGQEEGSLRRTRPQDWENTPGLGAAQLGHDGVMTRAAQLLMTDRAQLLQTEARALVQWGKRICPLPNARWHIGCFQRSLVRFLFFIIVMRI